MNSMVERAENSRKQAASLQLQMNTLCRHHKEELAVKYEDIAKLKDKLSASENAYISLEKSCEQKVG